MDSVCGVPKKKKNLRAQLHGNSFKLLLILGFFPELGRVAFPVEQVGSIALCSQTRRALAAVKLSVTPDHESR